VQLYDPFIERDLAAIPAAVATHRAEHGSIETFKAIARFAVLAYAPSQHAKHALLACLAAWDVRDDPRFDDIVRQCAVYAAESRQPWSEPPIMTPPAIDDDQRGDVDELLAAIDASDRLRGERWLAKRYEDEDFLRDYFAAAADDFDDLGHKLIVASAANRLIPVVGEQGRFATLRLGIWEMTAYRGEECYVEQGVALDAETLFARLIDHFVADRGDIVDAHSLFLLDAALETHDELVIRRVRDFLSSSVVAAEPAPPPPRTPEVTAYKLARDYAECLKIHALARRLAPRFPKLPIDAMLAAADDHLERSHFDEMSFA